MALSTEMQQLIDEYVAAQVRAAGKAPNDQPAINDVWIEALGLTDAERLAVLKNFAQTRYDEEVAAKLPALTALAADYDTRIAFYDALRR